MSKIKTPEKYYFPVDDYGNCTQKCKVRIYTGIGSVMCKVCEHNLGHNDKKEIPATWIKCAVLDKAIETPNNE
jgi:hypothetical protein